MFSLAFHQRLRLDLLCLQADPGVRGMDGQLLFGDKHSLTNRVDLQIADFCLFQKV